jgi:lipopolysaccharide/colanic/teichoic acid biosynthesis glycosyltransferase
LPQLLNVLRLQMALIGPRPTVIEQVLKYDAVQRRRLDVRPGLTGWAQVNGSIELSWDERITLDVWYIAHWSLRLDAAILFRTAAVAVFGEHRDEQALSEARAYTVRLARAAEADNRALHSSIRGSGLDMG